MSKSMLIMDGREIEIDWGDHGDEYPKHPIEIQSDNYILRLKIKSLEVEVERLNQFIDSLLEK